MKLIKPSFEIIEQQAGIEAVYKQIELAGRTCYKSENKITENSAKTFVDKMIKSGHNAILEHGTVYLYIPPEAPITGYKYRDNKYSKYIERREHINKIPYIHKYITTNYRVLVENDWLDDLEYLCEPTEYHEKRISVRFICDRGVSHEFVRHRVFSFAQESTRYCNYSKNKFNNELTFIIPCWLNIPEGKYTNIAKRSNEDGEYEQIMLHENNVNAYSLTTTPEGRFLWNCYWNEHDYFDLLNYNWKPQEARAILSNSLKTELFMTGFISDWWGYTNVIINKSMIHSINNSAVVEHKNLFNYKDDNHRVIKNGFFLLRCAKNAHSQARELAIPLMEEFIKRGYIDE